MRASPIAEAWDIRSNPIKLDFQAETVAMGRGLASAPWSVGAEVFSYGRNHFLGFLKHVDVDVEHRHGGGGVLTQTVPETMVQGGYET